MKRILHLQARIQDPATAVLHLEPMRIVEVNTTVQPFIPGPVEVHILWIAMARSATFKKY